VSSCTTLNTLFELLRDTLHAYGVPAGIKPVDRDFRSGDVRHRQADVSKAKRWLGYEPSHTLAQGIPVAAEWYVSN
jgi:UDP-N-acetylglucosamine 4-epimerase